MVSVFYYMLPCALMEPKKIPSPGAESFFCVQLDSYIKLSEDVFLENIHNESKTFIKKRLCPLNICVNVYLCSNLHKP